MIDLKQGDCLELMKNIPDKSIDLTVTSPPYDDLRTYNGCISQWSFEKFKNIARELYRITKDGGVVVWIVNDATIKGSETGTSFKQALYFKDCGFNLHDTMIWRKPTFTATGSIAVRYAPVFEYMFVFSKGKVKTFNPIKDKQNARAGQYFHGTIRGRDGGTERRITGDKKRKLHNSVNDTMFGIYHLKNQIQKDAIRLNFQSRSQQIILFRGQMRMILYSIVLWAAEQQELLV